MHVFYNRREGDSLSMAMVSPQLGTAGTFGGFGKIVTVDHTWEDIMSQSTPVSPPSPPMATTCVSFITHNYMHGHCVASARSALEQVE